ncbi:hypothetical protein [Marispirochaeta aestuarii]|uniref:LysM peptidoglycan-binding domain-containing protein n=1 Tax=Marispirochaeta aestuarii TaxID=1963862 RepID=UPI002ABD1C60|nr:hypothetical protein [Marispirochaeta aestuarii]
MKHGIIFILVLVLSVSAVSAQSLRDNPDYRESLRYKQLSEEALEDGEYLKAREYAELSAEYAQKSDEYVARMLAQYRANQLLQRAVGLRGQVERSGRSRENPADFAKAVGFIEAAGELYNNGSYSQSSESSREAIALLETFGGARTVQPQEPGEEPSKSGLPAAYLVRKLPGAEDCFWRIAGYPFVYGDTSAWKPLYEANKNKLPQPDNWDLMYPGMVMDIPSRPGEERSGIWVNGEIKSQVPRN